MNDLYRAYQPWLRGWLQRRLGCSHQAADLAQDTFVRLLHSRELAELREPRAFLTRVAQGMSANHWRRRQVKRA